MLTIQQSLAMYRVSLWMLSAWPCYWNAIGQHLIRQMGDDMRPPFILDFECTDETGRYLTSILAEPRGHMLVLKYLDFPDIVQICNSKEKQSLIKNMIWKLFSQEGVAPSKIKYYRSYEIEDEKWYT